MKYYISEKALESMERECRRSPNTETGGILVGYRADQDASDDSKVIITHASGPGPESSASATHFVKDTPYLQSVLELLFQYHQVNYLGVWHKHPGDMSWPSSGDVSSAMQEIEGGTVGLQELVTPIATMNSGRVEIHPHVIRDGSALPVSWESVPHDQLPDGRSVANQWHETEAGLNRLKEEMAEFEAQDIEVEVRRGDDGTY
ncbi:MAG: Mov34/MPN/PAD-1 family protein, partial [SAR202 cluster bacterium]|nr:Mov34/MPN/PAD-1 family protein [SAR202 cluster bacterium]